MKIRFLGTAAAEGIPAVFCNCEVCEAARRDKALRRSRSQVYIDDVMSVDFPSDAYMHAVEHGLDYSGLKYLLVTHSHMDHFYAHDFCLRGSKYSRNSKFLEKTLTVLGNSEVMDVFDECTRREMDEETASGFELVRIEPFGEYVLGPYRVLTLPAVHSPREQCMLFYVEKDGGRGYLHLYDTGPFDLKNLDFLVEKGAVVGAVAFDCTFVADKSKNAARHMGLPDDLLIRDALAERGLFAADTKFIVTHFSHNSAPSAKILAQMECDYGVIAAYDGLTIEI
ncbi:MAG: MBL fold metallo-hydrolase [Clostridia bacterium]|nr:MBL fold metallo-hydrolase [Clostridia bacterium]